MARGQAITSTTEAGRRLLTMLDRDWVARHPHPDFIDACWACDAILAIEREARADLAARIVAAVESLPGMAVTEWYTEPLWVNRSAVLDAIREASDG